MHFYYGNICNIKLSPNESSVQPAVVTLANLGNLTSNGAKDAVNSLSGLSYYGSEVQPNVRHISLEDTRGVCENELWNAQRDAKKKLHTWREKRLATAAKKDEEE